MKAKTLDKSTLMTYNVFVINTMTIKPNKNTIPQAVVQEAEYMSKVTGLSFRECLTLLMNTTFKNKSED